jgi:asparagine synthase (glutamine-hydrolysing)
LGRRHGAKNSWNAGARQKITSGAALVGAFYGELCLDWQAPIDAAQFAQALARQKHRANAGHTQRVAPGAALCWQNAGTPNDAQLLGQPWVDRQLWVVFDGALHNRAALCKTLELPENTRILAIIVAAWRRFGAELAAKLEGNFAVVIIDFAARQLLLARDVLGGRALHFCELPATAQAPAKIQFASEEQALAASSAPISELAIARYFGFAEHTQPESTVWPGTFAHTQTLPAGATALFTGAQRRVSRVSITQQSRARRWHAADAAAEFRHLLDRSVALHLPSSEAPVSVFPASPLESRDERHGRNEAESCLGKTFKPEESDPGRVAISLSGGLDSNALFASAADVLAPARLCAVSWRFEQQLECDESRFAIEHAAARGVAMVSFNADSLFAFQRESECATQLHGNVHELRPVSLSTPRANIYRELKTYAYAQAANVGARTFFNGAFGDHLFPDPSEWLCDALAWRDFAGIARQYRYLAHSAGKTPWRYVASAGFWYEPGFRRAVRRGLGLAIYGGAGTLVLTDYARNLLAEHTHSPERGMHALQQRLCFGVNAAFGASGEAEFAERFGIDACTPLRNVALLEFMLSLPISLSYREGVSKWLVREALRGSLPETIRTRPKSTSLQPFFDAALAGAANAHATLLLFAPCADWPRFYDAAKITALFNATQRTDAQSALIWQCLSYESWRVARGLR